MASTGDGATATAVATMGLLGIAACSAGLARKNGQGRREEGDSSYSAGRFMLEEVASGSCAAVHAVLREKGLTAADAKDKAAMFASAAKRLVEEGRGGSKCKLFWVPGRVEVCGKHTDNGW